MRTNNKMRLEIPSKSENERFARTVCAAFILELDPTLEEMSEIKTAISEAVTNAIIHGYENEMESVRLSCDRDGQQLVVTVEDKGVGIADVEQAMQPFYTTKPQLERSGMGFAFMEAFMDKVEVESSPGKGTTVKMEKTIGKGRNAWTTQSL